MRTIKFRMWDAIKKAWASPEGLDFLTTSNRICFIERNGITPSQFTGLKDKAGKEIYEGDIVQWKRSSIETLQFEVEFVDACFMPFYVEHSVHHFTVTPQDVEVIGNIWEDGALLNETKPN